MFYVYRFLNEDGEIIYVGLTESLVTRLTTQHFTKNGHLPEECYAETVAVEYAEFPSKVDMQVYEDLLIKKLNPKYNRRGTCAVPLSFPVPEVQWKKFEKVAKVEETVPVKQLESVGVDDVQIKLRLKELYKERGLTQKQVAEMMGIRESTLSGLATNSRTSWDVSILRRLIAFFGITSLDELFDFNVISDWSDVEEYCE